MQQLVFSHTHNYTLKLSLDISSRIHPILPSPPHTKILKLTTSEFSSIHFRAHLTTPALCVMSMTCSGLRRMVNIVNKASASLLPLFGLAKTIRGVHSVSRPRSLIIRISARLKSVRLLPLVDDDHEDDEAFLSVCAT